MNSVHNALVELPLVWSFLARAAPLPGPFPPVPPGAGPPPVLAPRCWSQLHLGKLHFGDE